MSTRKITDYFKADFYDHQAWNQKKIVCGIDEVGRGCLAGPVVTAAVILNNYKTNNYKINYSIPAFIKDSKLLSEKKRIQAYNWLIDNSTFAVSITNNRFIDRFNIYQATLYSMKRSLIQLSNKIKHYPDIVLVDAMPVKLSTIDLNILYFNSGEKQSVSIAAASIIAKVTRDNLMKRINSSFPRYNFKQHKGYATKQHRSVLTENRSSCIHRSSFLKKILDNSNLL